MKPLVPIAVFILLAVIAGLGFIYSGTFNVGATVPDSSLMHWVLSTTGDRSVAHHAIGIVPPNNLDNPEVIRAGFGKYRNDCAMCHGTPGNYPAVVGKGLNPKPPKLAESAKDMSPAEMYWVVTNGIKMTGMPSWSYTEPDAWSVVAFVKQLPKMTEQQYQEMKQSAEHDPAAEKQQRLASEPTWQPERLRYRPGHRTCGSTCCPPP